MFVILLQYIKPLEEVDQFIPAHRSYLDDLYAKNIFLASGPKVPRTGGVILASGVSHEELWDHLKRDPFYVNGVADYEVVEFNPVKYNAALKEFV